MNNFPEIDAPTERSVAGNEDQHHRSLCPIFSFVVGFSLPFRTAAATVATKPGVICDVF